MSVRAKLSAPRPLAGGNGRGARSIAEQGRMGLRPRVQWSPCPIPLRGKFNSSTVATPTLQR